MLTAPSTRFPVPLHYAYHVRRRGHHRPLHHHWSRRLLLTHAHQDRAIQPAPPGSQQPPERTTRISKRPRTSVTSRPPASARSPRRSPRSTASPPASWPSPSPRPPDAPSATAKATRDRIGRYHTARHRADRSSPTDNYYKSIDAFYNLRSTAMSGHATTLSAHLASQQHQRTAPSSLTRIPGIGGTFDASHRAHALARSSAPSPPALASVKIPSSATAKASSTKASTSPLRSAPPFAPPPTASSSPPVSQTATVARSSSITATI